MKAVLSKWQGAIEINGTRYESVTDAIEAFKSLNSRSDIKLYASAVKASTEQNRQPVEQITDVQEYEITVKKYMTQPSSNGFDFMRKWNNNIPMPCVTMRGTQEKETRGMVYMNLHGFAKPTINCMCCGRELTNPVSRYYGIGPICLGKIGIVRQIDDIEGIKEDLVKMKWSGWIIKSAITSRKEIKND